MKLRYIPAFVAIILSGFCQQSYSQNFIATIDMLPLETVSLSDLDITVPQNAPILFFANITNDNTARVINITISLNAASRGYIGKLSLNGQAIGANATLRLTNRNFNSVDMNGTVGKQFLNDVKASGTFPPDEYSYSLNVTDNQGNQLGGDSSKSEVSNPKNNPELITPGAAFDRELENTYTPFPLFQWFGQTDKFDLALYEVRPGQTSEEAVRNIAQFKLADITGNKFLYPSYAEKLVNGKTYAWQVMGKLQSARGTQYLPSEVFRFKYVDLGAGTGGGTTAGTTLPKTVSKIQITPQEIEVNAGQQMQFSAMFFDQDNNMVLNVTPQWAVTPSNKGTVTQSGLFTAGQDGASVAVMVKTGIINDFATVTIKPKQVNLDMNNNEWMIDAMIKQLFGLPN